ncbi:MAG: divergent polysaccharide deacetylase family protein, partial [Woeseiaceae bacterium]
MTWRPLLVAVLLTAASPLNFAASSPRIAIIIDDIGYRTAAAYRAIELPGPVACAILPDAPRARQLALAANEGGKEVLLHLPMDAVGSGRLAEPTQVTLDMSRASFAAVVDTALGSVPHAIGVSNHRGSLLTRHPGHMRWLMEEMRARDGLFFVDSYTTHESVALQIAAEMGVQAVRRDVFLDNDRSEPAIEQEFERLKSLATEHGVAVAIGHPYEATLAFLEKEIPRLAEQGFELVPVSELVNQGVL